MGSSPIALTNKIKGLFPRAYPEREVNEESGTARLTPLSDSGMTDPESLSQRISRLERLDDQIVRKASALFSSGAGFSSSDFFVFGAFKRTLAQSKGFRDLISAKNFPCAAALVRCQIDTAVRVNALAFVGNPDAFCRSLHLRSLRHYVGAARRVLGCFP
jgi:hypothetical protein